MTEKRFVRISVCGDWGVKDTENDKVLFFGTTDEVKDTIDVLNALHEENQQLKKRIEIKKQCCANSHNAHQFLKCYEKAINDLEEEYSGNSVAMEVLDKLDKYYDKYERKVDLE